MRTTKEKPKSVTGRYDSLVDFVNDAFVSSTGNDAAVTSCAAQRRGDWFGLGDKTNPSATDIMNTVKTGWAKGAERVAQFASEISIPKLASVRRRAEWCDQGDMIDMDRVRAGQLDVAWRRTRRAYAGNPPRVVLAVDSIAQGGKDAEEMFWQGAAAAALADALIAAGYSVKCISAFRGSDGCNMDVQVVVKDYDAPWSLSDAASSLALPGFFRAIGHMWQVAHSLAKPSHYGMSVWNVSMEQIDAPEAQYIFLAPQDLSSLATAKAWIESAIKYLEGEHDEQQEAIARHDTPNMLRRR